MAKETKIRLATLIAVVVACFVGLGLLQRFIPAVASGGFVKGVVSSEVSALKLGATEQRATHKALEGDYNDHKEKQAKLEGVIEERTRITAEQVQAIYNKIVAEK